MGKEKQDRVDMIKSKDRNGYTRVKVIFLCEVLADECLFGLNVGNPDWCSFMPSSSGKSDIVSEVHRMGMDTE